MIGIVTMSLLGACASDNNPPPPPEQTGSSCTAASAATACYPNLDGATLQGGGPVCIEKVPGGYCTHLCTMDKDCCAVPGECKTQHPQVCAPFENMTMQYCFLSCENEDLADAGVTDADTFCATFAQAGLTCRATGGGAPRKVCMP
jgi:hypothetical protein